MTVNRTTIALSQGLERPLEGLAGAALARTSTPRNLLLVAAVLGILALVAL